MRLLYSNPLSCKAHPPRLSSHPASSLSAVLCGFREEPSFIPSILRCFLNKNELYGNPSRRSFGKLYSAPLGWPSLLPLFSLPKGGQSWGLPQTLHPLRQLRIYLMYVLPRGPPAECTRPHVTEKSHHSGTQTAFKRRAVYSFWDASSLLSNFLKIISFPIYIQRRRRGGGQSACASCLLK